MDIALFMLLITISMSPWRVSAATWPLILSTYCMNSSNGEAASLTLRSSIWERTMAKLLRCASSLSPRIFENWGRVGLGFTHHLHPSIQFPWALKPLWSDLAAGEAKRYDTSQLGMLPAKHSWFHPPLKGRGWGKRTPHVLCSQCLS